MNKRVRGGVVLVYICVCVCGQSIDTNMTKIIRSTCEKIF